MPLSEALAEREMHVFQIARGAVQQHDSRLGSPVNAASEIDHVLAKTADLDKLAARRVRALDEPYTNQRSRGARAKESGDNNKRGHSSPLVESPCATISSSASPRSHRSPRA